MSTKTTGNNKTKTVKKTTKAQKVVEPVVEKQEEVVEETKQRSKPETLVDYDCDSEKLNDQFASVNDKFDALYHEFVILRRHSKDLHRRYLSLFKKNEAAEQKALQKKLNRGKKDPPKYKVTKELTDFMGYDEGTLVARTDALAKVSTYVKENKLNNIEQEVEVNGEKVKKVNGVIFERDEKLMKLFPKLDDGEEYMKFTNILKYLKPHIGELVKSTPNS